MRVTPKVEDFNVAGAEMLFTPSHSLMVRQSSPQDLKREISAALYYLVIHKFGHIQICFVW